MNESEKKRKTLGKMFSFLFVIRQRLGGRAGHRSGSSEPGGRWFSTMASACRVPSGAGGWLSWDPPWATGKTPPRPLPQSPHSPAFLGTYGRDLGVSGPGLHFPCWGGGVSF